MANTQLLLLEDVDHLGRRGDVVAVKAGYARNCLIPKKRAIVASKHALNMRQKLQEERQQQAAQDLQEAQQLADRVQDLTLSIEVKVDPDGHLYGSVSALDIVALLQAEQVEVEKRNVVLPHAIKTTGTHVIELKFKENVSAQVNLTITAEGSAS